MLDNVRIDGIDHEQRFVDHRGNIGTGWHRHIWKSDLRHSEAKEVLGGFGNFGSRRDFIRDASAVLGIELNQSGDEHYATTGLLFS